MFVRVKFLKKFDRGIRATQIFCVLYTVSRPVIHKVLKTRIWGLPRPAWAAGSYSSGPPAGGTPQILVDKTSHMTGRLRV